MIPYIKRIKVKNYKSLASISVHLDHLTVLVGPNGAGKSNFIDALAFVQQCLSDSIDLAFKARGGIGAVRRKSGGHPTNIGIQISLALKDNLSADYSFEIAAKSGEQFKVARERCIVRRFMGDEHKFEVRDGKFVTEIPGIRPQLLPDRFALYAASGTEEFRPVYDFLTSMRFYSIVPDRIRELQEADSGEFLTRDGSNAAAVLKRLRGASTKDSRYDRVCRLLSKVVNGIERVEYHSIGQKETIKFKQNIGLKDPWTFDALNMSDGTLRVLGLLLAVYQRGKTSVIGIEEPESTVHPAVAELIIQVLDDASSERQVITTTHSPDVLDSKSFSDSSIRGVIMEKGKTIIAPLSEASRNVIRENLYTPGELLRSNELEFDISATHTDRQIDIFSQPHFDKSI